MRRVITRLRRHVTVATAAALLLWSGGCSDDAATGQPGGGQPGGGGAGGYAGSGGQGAGEPLTDATVRVVDPDGNPVPGAFVMMGGQSAELWVETDAEGRATIMPVDDGVSESWFLAGKEGWLSGGVPVDLDDGSVDAFEITMRPLPLTDNPTYAFQPGGDGHSPDASFCGHCHPTIGDDWAGSAHRHAADNPRTWDLYAGTALGAADVSSCSDLGGHQAEGQVPGAVGQTTTRCYVPRGVLSWLNAGCGGVGQQGCDHPEQRPLLTRFGACGDCHAPAIDGGVPGSIDLAAAVGVGFEEGVACDFCHKIRSVDPGPSAGLDGGIELLRPSEETTVSGQQFDPITFGPYPDVIVAIMFGSYVPQYREASWCAGCHEYNQAALHPSESIVNPTRFPNGLPVHETYSEFLAWPGSASSSCQTCHMLPIDEESSTYNISEKGLRPSVDQGWLREYGQVRHHDFPVAAGLPGLSLDLQQAGGDLQATVTVSNQVAGHAVPTGEPLHQMLVLLSAVDGNGAEVDAVGGQVVPDIGGAIATGVVGTDVTVNGSAVTLSGHSFADPPPAVRFARPTGSWDDYAGPGTAPFTTGGLSAQDKGLEKHAFIAEIAVASAAGDTLTLGAAPPALQAGDVAYVVGSSHRAGAPGWVYAKTMVDSNSRRGVAHYRAVDIASDNRIGPGASGASVHLFPLPPMGESITVTATLVRRRYGATVADLYGWDVDDTDIATVQKTHP